jgi:hypothetical protein
VMYLREPEPPPRPRWTVTPAAPEAVVPEVVFGEAVPGPGAALSVGITDGAFTNTQSTPADLTQPGTVWINNFVVISIDAGAY